MHCDQPGRRPFFACFSSSSLASASCEKGASSTAAGKTDAGGSGSFSRGRQRDRGRRRKYEALGGLCGGDRLRQLGDCGRGDCHGPTASSPTNLVDGSPMPRASWKS